LGLVAAFAIPPASTRSKRWVQLVFVPLGLVLATVIIRSVKLGHVPVLANALVPILACLLGAALGLVLSQSGWRAAFGAVAGGVGRDSGCVCRLGLGLVSQRFVRLEPRDRGAVATARGQQRRASAGWKAVRRHAADCVRAEFRCSSAGQPNGAQSRRDHGAGG